MKKSIVLFVFLLLILSITGCSSDTYSNELIIDSEKIDSMYFDVIAQGGEVISGNILNTGDTYNIDVNNKELVEAVLDLLKGIKVEKLSLEQVQEIFENQEVFANQINYQINLSASSETRDNPFKGLVFVLREEKLIFVDLKKLNPDETHVLYITKEKQTEVINGLIEIIEEAKHEFLN